MKPLFATSRLLLLVLTTQTAHAVGLEDVAAAAAAVQHGTQALQAGQKAMKTVPGSSAGLTTALMKQLGVTQAQAQGGAGAIMQLAKSRMQAAAFTKLNSALPGMQTLLAAAPQMPAANGGAASLLGLASSFQQLGLAPTMVQSFVPVVMRYVQGTGGGALSSVLQAALLGGL